MRLCIIPACCRQMFKRSDIRICDSKDALCTNYATLSASKIASWRRQSVIKKHARGDSAPN